MTLETIRPRRLLESPPSPFRMWREMERWLEEPWRLWRRTPTEGISFTPAMCMWEKADSFTVDLELPGVKAEDVEISLVGDQLNVKGKYSPPAGVKDEEYITCETSFGSFSRTIDLPASVESDKIEATHRDGILEILLPKSKKVQPHKIEVKAKA